MASVARTGARQASAENVANDREMAGKRDRLRALGHEVEWHEYPMEHQVCLEELEAIGAYLRARLGD